jgi:hypothetical protein
MLTKFASAVTAAALAAGLPVALAAGLLAAPAAVLAQSTQTLAPPRLVPIPINAKRAEMVFNGTSIVLVDGKRAHLAPGARIFGADNMLKMVGGLNGKAIGKYQVEQNTGLLMNVWILTDREILTPDPKPGPTTGTTSNVTSSMPERAATQ